MMAAEATKHISEFYVIQTVHFYIIYKPTHALNKIQHTNHKKQFMIGTNSYVLAPECHLHGAYELLILFVCRLPKDSTLVPKHAGIGTYHK